MQHGEEEEEEEHEADDCKTEDGEGDEEVVEGEAPPKRGRLDTAPSAASMPLPAAAPPAQHQTRLGEVDEGQQAAACQRGGTVAGTGATNLQPAPQQQQEAAAGRADSDWRPQAHLPRQQKVAVGTRCKQLIDAARLHWLRNQGFEATLLQYVPAAVSGENRLLLASTRSAAALSPSP